MVNIVIREMQSKTTNAVSSQDFQNGCNQNELIITVGKNMEKREPSYTIGGNVKCFSHCGNLYGGFSKNTKNRTIIWYSNSTLWLYLKKKNSLILKIHITPIFIAAVFTIAKIWKQLKCPPADEWKRCGVCVIYTWRNTTQP